MILAVVGEMTCCGKLPLSAVLPLVEGILPEELTEAIVCKLLGTLEETFAEFVADVFEGILTADVD